MKTPFITLVLLVTGIQFASAAVPQKQGDPGSVDNGTNTSATAASAGSPVESLLNEEMIRGLRDPFQIPSILLMKLIPRTDLEMIQLKDIRLNGVITGPKKVKAMVSGPGGKSYFISLGESIGMREGRVTAITPDAIKVVEYETDERGRKIPEVMEVRLNGEVVSLTKPEE